MKSDWVPKWEAERRAPDFVGGSASTAFHGHRQKYLWGNMPALDVLALSRNEGSSYGHDLHVLFAGEDHQLSAMTMKLNHSLQLRVMFVISWKQYLVSPMSIKRPSH